MQTAMTSSKEMHKGALLKAKEIYALTMKGLTPEGLIKNPEPDANGKLDPNDYAHALDKFKAHHPNERGRGRAVRRSELKVYKAI